MLRAAALTLLGAFAPRHCAGCDTVGDLAVCGGCAGLIARLRQPPERPGRHGPISAAFPFEEPVRRIVHRTKYGGERAAMAALAELAAVRLQDRLLGSPSVVVPVPLGRRRRRQRGFNQSAVIAGVLARGTGLTLGEGLARVRETPSQVGRDAAGRRGNVGDCFAWRSGDLSGATVWLIDDVLTTGATAEAAAAALVAAGAAAVETAVIAEALSGSAFGSAGL